MILCVWEKIKGFYLEMGGGTTHAKLVCPPRERGLAAGGVRAYPSILPCIPGCLLASLENPGCKPDTHLP